MSLSFQPDLFSTCAVGVAGALVGALAMLLAPRRANWRGALALSGLFLLASVATAALRLPQMVWLPGLALAGAFALFALARTAALEAMAGGLGGVVRHPRGQGGLLFAASAGLLLWQGAELDRDAPEEFKRPEPSVLSRPVGLVALPGPALTDAGNPVTLYRAAPDEDPTFEPGAWLRTRGLDERVIRTAPPSLDYNCHGYTFAGGHSWVQSASVDLILKDNHYRTVSKPEAGDVAVYRGAGGKVTHSGVVRVAHDGLLLIESKWGRAGRYLHAPDYHVYGGNACTYYRSDRPGHLLLKLPEGSVRPASLPAA